jgi:DNA-binding NarL/FixJ family response regulator
VKRILIVDDSPLIRSSLRVLLEEQLGMAVAEAKNGSDGIDKAQKLRPDLIVIDLVMPVMNGIDASRTLKRLMPAVAILMYTTFADPCIKNVALAAGVQAVFDKTEPAELIGSIQQFLLDEMLPPSTNAA